MSHRAKRRRRKPPQAYTQLSAAEEKFFQQAMRNSKVDTKRPDGKLEVPYAPTFYPTIEDMEGNPLDFVEKIRPQAQKYGICKIVPPKGWNPPFGKYCIFLHTADTLSFSLLIAIFWKLPLLVLATVNVALVDISFDCYLSCLPTFH